MKYIEKTKLDTDFKIILDECNNWILTILKVLVHSNIYVFSLILKGDYCELKIKNNSGDIITILFSPHRPTVPVWKEFSGWFIWYQLTKETLFVKHFMSLFSQLLIKIKPQLPTTLDAYGFVINNSKYTSSIFPEVFPFLTIENSEQLGAGQITEILVRVTHQCNQKCPFCSGPSYSIPSTTFLKTCIKEIDECFNDSMLTFTGGEPTLRKTLIDEINVAKACENIAEIQIQTNAVQFAKIDYLEKFPQNIKISFFISLHALDEALYNQCTNTENQYHLAVKGIQNILDRGYKVFINIVISSINIDHFEDYLTIFQNKFVANYNSKPILHISNLIVPEFNQQAGEYIVSYSQFLKILSKCRTKLRELGVTSRSLFSSTHASMPMCLMKEDMEKIGRVRYTVNQDSVGYEDYTKDWIKAHSCRKCKFNNVCLGVPNVYAKRFGLSELNVVDR